MTDEEAEAQADALRALKEAGWQLSFIGPPIIREERGAEGVVFHVSWPVRAELPLAPIYRATLEG